VPESDDATVDDSTELTNRQTRSRYRNQLKGGTLMVADKNRVRIILGMVQDESSFRNH
jgi:hypothetical protein